MQDEGSLSFKYERRRDAECADAFVMHELGFRIYRAFNASKIIGWKQNTCTIDILSANRQRLPPNVSSRKAIKRNLPGLSSICMTYAQCSYNMATYSFKGYLYHANTLPEWSGKIYQHLLCTPCKLLFLEFLRCSLSCLSVVAGCTVLGLC